MEPWPGGRACGPGGHAGRAAVGPNYPRRAASRVRSWSGRPGLPFRDAGRSRRGSGKPLRDAGRPFRGSGKPFRDAGRPLRGSGKPFRDAGRPLRGSRRPFR